MDGWCCLLEVLLVFFFRTHLRHFAYLFGCLDMAQEWSTYKDWIGHGTLILRASLWSLPLISRYISWTFNRCRGFFPPKYYRFPTDLGGEPWSTHSTWCDHGPGSPEMVPTIHEHIRILRRIRKARLCALQPWFPRKGRWPSVHQVGRRFLEKRWKNDQNMTCLVMDP